MTPTVTLPHWIEDGRPLFVQYHGPAGETRDLGVVLCKSFGHEMMATHRAFRHLADRLAEAGFPTLRIDYDGAGESAGTDLDVDRVPMWRASIDRAVRSLERRGIQQIALVGLRFGALLAAEYAKSRPVDALVLIAPPASGRAYLRELRALQSVRFGDLAASNGANGTHGANVAYEELVGFLLRADAASQIENLSWVGASRPARRVLIVPRDDLPRQEARLAQQLTALGAAVTLSSVKGYGAMGESDPVKSVVPTAMWQEVVGWLASAPSETMAVNSGRGLSRVAILRATEDEEPVLEEIVDIDGMVGVLSSPGDGPRRTGPVVCLQNVGANHRVGCNRLYVDLARRWAALGFSVLRYDLGGIGDTKAPPGRGENEVYSSEAIADVRRAIAWAAETRNTDRIILAGICSGAYASYYAALGEPRVRGLMLMNPLTFHWRQGDSLDVRSRSTLKSTDFYRRAALELETWKRLARREVHVQAIAGKIAARAWTRVKSLTGLRSETDVAQGFRRLCDRGASVFLVCGEDDASRDVIAEHLGPEAENFTDQSHFRFAIVPRTDHTFAPWNARRDLIDRLTTHLLASEPLSALRSGRPPASRRFDSLRALWKP